LKLSKYRLWFLPLAVGVILAGLFLRPEPKPVEKSSFLMGTLVRVKAFGPEAPETVAEAMEQLADMERLLSTNLASSDVSRVNDAGPKGTVVSPLTEELLGEALRFADLTDGTFDPTVGPLVRLWGIGTEDARVPEKDEIKTALLRVGRNRVRIEEGRRVFLAPGQALDLGGIAKGYAADRLRERLLAGGVSSGLIDLGGNILVFGNPPHGKLWRIGVQDPKEPRGGVLGVVELAGGSVVTSGVYERFFEREGVRYHHILDPCTGYPARSGLLAVTVLSSNSLEGDALSTALFVMGLERGMKLVESLDGVEALFVTEDGGVVLSSGMKGCFSLLGKGYRLEAR
jgi:thiamine biosynthesis lipoprotein